MPAKHYPVSARSVATWQSMLFFRTSLQDGCMELQSRAWPARTNMASSYKYGQLVQMARLYGAWIEFLTFKRCVYGYS